MSRPDEVPGLADATRHRIVVVLRVLATRLDVAEAANQLGVDTAQVERWADGLTACCRRALVQRQP